MKHRSVSVGVLAVCLLAANFASSQSKSKPLTNSDVVAMVKAGLPDDVIINSMAAQDTNFDVSATALLSLKKQGVSTKVLNAMLSASTKHQGSESTPAAPAASPNVSPPKHAVETAPEPSAPALAAPSNTPVTAAQPGISGVYKGEFRCGIAKFDLALSLNAANPGSLTAKFDFSELFPQESQQRYIYDLSGSYEPRTEKFRLNPVRWESAPLPGYKIMGMKGTFDLADQRLSGKMNNFLCPGFHLTRDHVPAAQSQPSPQHTSSLPHKVPGAGLQSASASYQEETRPNQSEEGPEQDQTTAVAHNSSGLAFEAFHEPDYVSLFKLYMASNSDIMNTDAYAWDYHMAFIDPTTDTDMVACARFKEGLQNEITRANFIQQARGELAEGVKIAKGWPKTAIYRVTTSERLGTYDLNRQEFPVLPGFGVGVHFATIAHVTVKVPKGLWAFANQPRHGKPPRYMCVPFSFSPSPWDSMDYESPGKQLLLEVSGGEKINWLPMARNEAQAYLNADLGQREVDLDVLLRAGPAPSLPGKRNSIPTHIIAARALNPRTGEVLYVYDLTKPYEALPANKYHGGPK